MEYHLGRLLDHVHIRVSDLDESQRFYRTVLQSLGLDISGEGEGYFYADELFFTADKEPTTGLHLAFQAGNRQEVHDFYAAGLAAGGIDNGAPGERPQYHPGYYGAYILDPDGNNLEAVFHGSAERSAESVVVRPVDSPE